MWVADRSASGGGAFAGGREAAQDQLDDALSRHGVPLTLSQIKPENLEELIDHLEDLTVDVDANDEGRTKVRVFCE